MKRILTQLKKQFLNKEFSLYELDSMVCGLIPTAESIFDYNTVEMLEDGFCYQTDYNIDMRGYHFNFEVVQEAEFIGNIVVKVIEICKI
jgi:hypothetical protein